MSFLSLLLDAIFPPLCFGCGKKGGYLCDSCLKKITRGELGSNTHALYSYKDPVIQKALFAFKYKKAKEVARLFALPLHKVITSLEKEDKENDVFLIPIPTTQKGLRGRGFNQAELLCKEIEHLFPKKYQVLTDVLKKKLGGLQQTKLTTKYERIQNMKDAFYLSEKDIIVGKTIVVIDDVTTTGATLLEAKRVLLKEGAKDVFLLAVAKQDKKF